MQISSVLSTFTATIWSNLYDEGQCLGVIHSASGLWLYFHPYARPTILTFNPVFSSSLPLLVEEGVSSPTRDTRTKSSLLRVDTESEDTLIFPTEPLSSMDAAVKLSHAAHEWKTGGGSGGRWWAKSPRKRKINKKGKSRKQSWCDETSEKHLLIGNLKQLLWLCVFGVILWGLLGI